MSGTMGFHEFRELWQVLNAWKSTFATYDQDRSGTVEGHELQKAIVSLGTATKPRSLSPDMKLPLCKYVYVQVTI